MLGRFRSCHRDNCHRDSCRQAVAARRRNLPAAARSARCQLTGMGMRLSWLTMEVLTKMSAMAAPRERKPPAVPARRQQGAAGGRQLGGGPCIALHYCSGALPASLPCIHAACSPVLMTRSGLRAWIAK